MKLASFKTGLDGQLMVISKDLTCACSVTDIAPTMQYAIDHWQQVSPALQIIYDKLNNEKKDAIEFTEEHYSAPIPRAYQWLDGSAYLYHVELVRKARGAEMPPEFLHDPLMYQGISSNLLGPKDDIFITNEQWGIDFEAEIMVILNDVPMGVAVNQAHEHIKLIGLVNDVSLRNLIPNELAKGFGFLNSKPPSSYSAVVVTPDELGESWQNNTINLPLIVHVNHEYFGSPNCGQDMNFNFAELIAHAAKSRPLIAGTLLGSGTISNRDPNSGSCCLAEKRMIEIIENGSPQTSFLSFGDRVRIEMFDKQGLSIFGAIDNVIKQSEL